uniref:Protein SMG7 n=1 Tax=Timema bartmani TaxID=61472 RepID=A0A7R9EZT2_9NEOP|nr:unnamed protein product [Timema bartmani]
MGLKAAVQALKKAEKLKEKVQNSKDILNDGEAWLCQKQLQNPKRTESQAMLSWCLEAASGFYLTLLQEMCTAFDLDLPFRRKGSIYGNSKLCRTSENFSQPHKSSCYYICQHCLVHLGDIARYRNQSKQAEAFYSYLTVHPFSLQTNVGAFPLSVNHFSGRLLQGINLAIDRHAVQLSPHSGQPYNQLALLEASRGDRLSTVFHYARSVAVRHFFPAAATNLTKTLNKSIEEQLNVEGRTKLSVSEYTSVFLKLHGLLHIGADLNLADQYVKLLTATLTAHVATESLSSWRLVQMLAINLYALHHAGSCIVSDSQVTTFTNKQLSADEQRVKCLVTDLLAGSLSAYLLPVYTLKEGDPLIDYFALPAIKLTLDWIRMKPDVLLDSAFTTRLQIWPSLCKLLNGVQLSLADFMADTYKYVPLPEDQDLQGFIPLEKALGKLRFSSQEWKTGQVTFNKLRANRLLEFGNWLATQNDYRLITQRPGDGEGVVFESVSGQQVPPRDLIRELEELSLTKLPSPAPSDTGSWGTGTSTPDHMGSTHSPPLSDTAQPLDMSHEKRVGILKPQGSLEKAREKENSDGDVNTAVAGSGNKKGRQNVAMQAIMRKTQQQGEQTPSSVSFRMLEPKTNKVTFKTPSPNLSPGAVVSTDENQANKLNSKPLAWQHQVSYSYQSQQPIPLAQPPPLHQSPQNQAPRQQHTLFDVSPPQQTQMRNMLHHNQTNSGNIQAFPPKITAGYPLAPTPFRHLPPHSLSAAANLPLSDPTVGGGAYPSPPRQSFGLNLRQPPYSPWQEEAPTSVPVNTWWGGDERFNRSASMSQEEQVATSFLPPNNYLHHMSVKPSSEVPSTELYSNGVNWGARPTGVNLNLHRQLSSLLSQPPPQQDLYTPPAATQATYAHASTLKSNVVTNGVYQNMQQRGADLNHLSMFSGQESRVHTAEHQQLKQKATKTNNLSLGGEPSSGVFSSTYSLFSSPSWVGPPITSGGPDVDSVVGSPANNSLTMGQQSLWSGPGPSPLERLLEQQKQLREGPAPKGGT